MQDEENGGSQSTPRSSKPRAQQSEAVAPVAKPAPAKPVALVRTPAQWAEKLGHAKAARAHIPQSTPRVSPAHAAADALYGWTQHAYDYQAEPFEITEEDYTKALAAAVQFPVVAPHAPALPPSQAKRFENFKPRASRKGHS